MSGPKSARYRVLSNEELLAARLQQTRSDARAGRERLLELISRLEAARAVYPEEAFATIEALDLADVERADLGQLEDYITSVRQRCARVESEFDSRVSSARLRASMAAATGGITGNALRAEDVLRRDPATRVTVGTRSAGSTTGEEPDAVVLRIMGRLAPGVRDEERYELEELATTALAAPSESRRDALLDELRLRVRRTNRESEVMEREAEQAVALLDSLRGLASPEIDELRPRLMQVERRQARLTEQLRTDAERARTSAEADADRSYALSAAKDVLAELGYEVGPEFETLVVRDGVAHVIRPKWSGYAVRIRGDSRASLNFNVVRTAAADERSKEAQRTRDREVEEAWCSDFQELERRMAKRGVLLQLSRAEPAGTVPVQLVPDHVMDTASARRRSKRPREQTR